MNKHWPLMPLGEVLTERQEKPDPTSLDSGHIPIIAKVGFNDGQIQLRTGGDTKTGMILIRPGDVVVSGINAAKGAIALYGEAETRPIAATIHYGAYVPDKSRVDVSYLWWLLRSGTFRALLQEYVPGGIKTELKAKRFLPIPVPIPPIFEQRRIVAHIDELAAKIEEAKALRRETIQEASTIIFSILEHLHSTHKNFAKLQIASCSNMSTGTTPPTFRSDYYGGSLQWYTPGDMETKMKLGRSCKTLSDVAVAEGKARVFAPGTVLLVAIGGSLGKVGLADEICSANQQITGIMFDKRIAPEYGFWCMRGLYNDLRASAPQATLPIINQERIGRFDVVVPPLPEQARIVAYLDGLQDKVDTLKSLQAETAADLDALLLSVLDRAFTGRL